MKNSRQIKINSVNRYSGKVGNMTCKKIPSLNLTGLWLNECGFDINDNVIISITDGCLTIKKA